MGNFCVTDVVIIGNFSVTNLTMGNFCVTDVVIIGNFFVLQLRLFVQWRYRPMAILTVLALWMFVIF